MDKYNTDLFSEVINQKVRAFQCFACGEQLDKERKCIYTRNRCDECCKCGSHK